MITKSFSASNVQVKDAATGEFEAVFATLGVIDKDGDVITKGAIEDGAKVVISAYGHSVWKGSAPVGTGTIHEVGNEAVCRGQYFMDTTKGRDDFNTVAGLAKSGQGEWSFGLLEVKSEPGEVGGVKANMIKAVHVPEVSPVFIGAGVATRTTMTKAASVKHLQSSVRRLLSSAGRTRWEFMDNYVSLEDYDLDQGFAVFGIHHRDGDRLVQVDFTYTDTSVELGAEETDVHMTHVFLPKSYVDTKFSEHADAVLTAADALADRAQEVVTLRAAKGKTIGSESSDALTKVCAVLDRFKALIDTPEPQPVPDEDDAANEAAANEYARSIAISQGVTS